MSEIFEKLQKAIVEGNDDLALELSRSALQDGISADDILKQGLIPGIRRVGELFNAGEYFLPELIVSGKAMNRAVDRISPMFTHEKAAPSKKYLIGTVHGDVHDIGKKIVSMMLKGNGWQVTDLGVDLAPEQFCEAVRDADYDILGMSALLTMTMPVAGETIKALQGAGLREKIKVMVGGAPVTQDYADQIGADAYGRDAWDAVVQAERLIGDR
jgi:5-methyltetrahydrofolate--homocysteine methyltransferase